jgi:hypothetical protein
METLDTNNLILLTIIYGAILLMIQRTERKRKLIAVVIALLPLGYATYQWGVLRNQMQVVLLAVGIALGLNILVWIVYGRKHPPGTSDSITVIGMEE